MNGAWQGMRRFTTSVHRERLDVLAALLVCLLIAATGVYMPLVLNYPSYFKDFLLQSVACILFLLWTVRLACSQSPAIGVSLRSFLPEILLVCYIALNFLAVGWSGLPYIAILGAFTVGFRVAWGLLVGGINWRGVALKAVSAAIVIAGLSAAVATLILRWSGNPDFAALVIGHRNFLAGFLLPPIFLMIAGAFRFRGARRIAAGAILFIMGYTLALCRSNGAMVGLSAGVAFLALISVSKAWRRRLLIFCACAAAVAIVFTVSRWIWIRPRLVTSEQATRYFHTVGALRMISARPLLGWGAGTFIARYPLFRPVEAERLGWMDQLTLHPHNEYLSVAVTTGLVGAALFIAALALMLRRVIRALPGHGQSGLVAGLIAGAVAMMTHGLFDVHLSFWGAGAMFWTLIGLLLAIGRPRPAPAVAPPRVSAIAALFLCVSTFAVAELWWRIPLQGLMSENSLTLARDAQKEGKWDAAEALYQDAIARSRYVPDYLSAHDYLANCLRGTRVADETAAARLERLNKAAASLERLRLLAPDLFIVDTELGETYISLAHEVGGHSPQLAKLQLGRAAAMFNAQVTVRPYHMVLPRRRLAELLHALSPDYLSVCVRQLQAAILVDPDDAASRFMLGEYLAEAGGLAEAVSQMKRAVALRVEAMARDLDKYDRARAAGDLAAAQRAKSFAESESKAIAIAHYSLAKILHAMRRDAEARRHLWAALGLVPG